MRKQWILRRGRIEEETHMQRDLSGPMWGNDEVHDHVGVYGQAKGGWHEHVHRSISLVLGETPKHRHEVLERRVEGRIRAVVPVDSAVVIVVLLVVEIQPFVLRAGNVGANVLM